MTKKFTYEILGKLPGLNEMIGAINRHRFAGNDLKKKYTKECATRAIIERVPKFNNPVRIHFDWIETDKRRDIDNVSAGAKYVLDSLVLTGKIPNDGPTHVKGISHAFPAPDKKNPRVKVTITEVEENPLKKSDDATI